ncbi:hypothetical protein [Pseudaminobacter salicylatoxidans]|nr:hypothetical protein [Pseudaminobacter salicylatoxidans]
MTRDEYEDAAAWFKHCGFTCPPAAELHRGGIVGIATIIDIVTEMDSPWFFGPKGLVVADARSVEFIPVGGRLGFFDWRELLPFAKGDGPVPPAKWMLPQDAKPSRPRPAGSQGSLL